MTARQHLTAQEFRAKPLGVSLKQFTDPQLDDFIQIATEAVEGFTERIFVKQSYTEKFVGDGSTTFLANNYPLVAVTSLSQATNAITPAVTTYDINRLLRTTANDACGRIALDGLGTITAFSGTSLYTLVYEAGYAAIPMTIKQATALWVAELMQPDYAGAGAGVEVVPLTTEQIVELLTPHKRRRI
jgi:hypothetical protein